MPWIFGSFLVTPCALTSCHVVISKQGSVNKAVAYNRCITGRRPCDKNYAVGFRQRQRIVSRARDTQPIRGVSACKQVQALAPLDFQKKGMGQEEVPLSEYMSLHLFLKPTTTCGSF